MDASTLAIHRLKNDGLAVGTSVKVSCVLLLLIIDVFKFSEIGLTDLAGSFFNISP